MFATSVTAGAAPATPDESAENHLLRGQKMEAADKYVEAIAEYSKAIALDAKVPAAYQLRGGAHFKLGKINESIADFDKYIELNPKAKVSHWQRGISYYYAGRYDDRTVARGHRCVRVYTSSRGR